MDSWARIHKSNPQADGIYTQELLKNWLELKTEKH